MNLIIKVLVFSIYIQLSIGQQRCASAGEYCQNHWDCCSNSCLSFSYKCVSSHTGNEQPTIIIPQQEIIQAQSISSVSELVDRFGTDSNSPPQSTTSQPINTNVEEHRIPICYEKGRSCLNSRQCCSGYCSRIINQCIESEENSSYEAVSQTNGDCKRIAEKCYSSNECCGQLKCHSYSQQCVT